jgi:hypothetical protein
MSVKKLQFAVVLLLGGLLGLVVAISGNLLPDQQAYAQDEGKETANAPRSLPETFAGRLKYSRAVEAAIWARPLTRFKAWMDGLQRDAGVGYNDIGYFSKVQTRNSSGPLPTPRPLMFSATGTSRRSPWSW